jgi:hypothetical protein
VTIHGSKSHP